MEARYRYVKKFLYCTIIEFVLQLEQEDAYEIIKILPEKNREKVKKLYKTAEEAVVRTEGNKFEGMEELFNKFITEVKIYHRILLGWDEVLKEIGRGYYKMKRKREKKEYYAAKLKEIKEKQQAKSFYKLKISRSEEVEEQEEVDLTDMEEYDLTGSGEPVYETPIMTPQLYCRIMANEFSQDQVEYIIKKSLHL